MKEYSDYLKNIPKDFPEQVLYLTDDYSMPAVSSKANELINSFFEANTKLKEFYDSCAKGNHSRV